MFTIHSIDPLTRRASPPVSLPAIRYGVIDLTPGVDWHRVPPVIAADALAKGGRA